jgi:Leucine-rich repeat (LRR) protein
MFADFSNLVLLDLSDNPIKFIHVNAFFGLENLQSLDLQGELQLFVRGLINLQLN